MPPSGKRPGSRPGSRRAASRQAAAPRRPAPRRAAAGAGTGASRRGPAGARASAGGTVTSHDVARLAGVSRSAVSRTYTPDASVSEKTRKKVLSAAAALGYQPNVIARSLITRQSRLIGLVMGEWENPFYTTMLRGFTEKFAQHDYRLMLLASRTPADVAAAMQMLMQYRVDGMLLVSVAPAPGPAIDFVRAGGRLVLINREADELPATVIVNDNERVGRELGERLLEGGYSRIAMVRGDPRLPSGIVRTAAMRAVLAASGRARIVIDRTGALGYAAGRAFGNEMMASPEPPDVIVCSTDMTAIGVLDAVRVDQGLEVPEAVGVVGFGDIPASGWASHDLTTVRLPLARLIDEAVATLLATGAAPLTAPHRVVIDGEIVLRSTLRRAAAAARS